MLESGLVVLPRVLSEPSVPKFVKWMKNCMLKAARDSLVVAGNTSYGRFTGGEVRPKEKRTL
jgi:hypothetical protein